VSAVLIDTVVFIDHLRGAHRLQVAEDTVWYSVVTRCELFAGSADGEDRIRTLLAPFGEMPVDRTIAEEAGRIRRSGRTRTPDALIAATARVHGLTLITRNVRDFADIPGLVVELPR
jgi:predicted nucleic acid-binding protein